MQRARDCGFRVNFIYISLDKPERSIDRVQARVLKGGHDVPDDDVRRRYRRSLANLPAAIRIADWATLYDNSEDAYWKMLEARDGRIVWSANEVAVWVAAVQVGLDR